MESIHTPADRLCCDAVAPITSQKAATKFPLLLPTLEGLAKYGHCMSVDYFTDLLVVMQALLSSASLPLYHRLQTLLTASTLLRCGPQ